MKEIEVQLDVLAPSATEAIVRGEVDTQIATAHKFPRSLEQFQKRAIAMVQLDEETAESCIYRRPVGKDGGQMKYAEGLSVRMAEIVAACYGNIRYGAQIVNQTERQVVARGFAHDLESNTAASSECVESTLKRDKTPMDERMRVVIAKAALAKARRDALFQVVPKALCKNIEREARRIIAGESKPLEVRRAAVAQWVSKLGIEANRVWAALGVAGPSELDDEKLITLTGLRTALKDGEITIEEAFPRVAAGGAVGQGEVPPGAAPKSPLTAKKPKAEEPADDSLDKWRKEIRARMEKAGIDEGKLISTLTGQGWAGVVDFDSLTVQHLASIADVWETLVEEIKG